MKAHKVQPILLRERAAQRVSDRKYLNEYSCPKCGDAKLASAFDASKSPLCKRCGIGREHGSKSDPRYRVWQSMRQRATNRKNKAAHRYSLRGIGMCDEWSRFAGFAAWEKFGEWKHGLEIDRIDNSKGYCPDNCRWVTRAENCRNRSTTKLNPESVRVIRMLCWSGLKQKHVAAIFGVSFHVVSRIVAWRSWDDV